HLRHSFTSICRIVSFLFFFFNDTAPTEIYTLSLHDALPISLTVKLSKYNVDDVALGVCKTGAEEAGVTEVRTSLSEKKFELWRRSEERIRRNAETDLVCRLLLEKKKKRIYLVDGSFAMARSLRSSSVLP